MNDTVDSIFKCLPIYHSMYYCAATTVVVIDGSEDFQRSFHEEILQRKHANSLDNTTLTVELVYLYRAHRRHGILCF